MPKVIYLTGAPAAGKTSTTRLIVRHVPDLKVWEYGARLTEHVKYKSAEVVSQLDVRSQSAKVVTPQDVAEVDQALLGFVEKHRSVNHIIIDSHPVTKEAYGYRITPFSLQQFALLRPDEIWVFYTNPEETQRRIAISAAGRPMVTEEEARLHTQLQASVAATYGVSLGCPVYMFDTTASQEELVFRLVGRLT